MTVMVNRRVSFETVRKPKKKFELGWFVKMKY